MSVDNEQALESLARTPRLLVALDFDGTVSPHDDDPMKARMLPAARDRACRMRTFDPVLPFFRRSRFTDDFSGWRPRLRRPVGDSSAR